VPAYVVHGAIGMGGDQLVAEVAGRTVEEAVGDEIRDRHAREYARLWPTVRLLPGADRLIGELKHRGHRVVLASSGSRRDCERALELVTDADRADGLVTGEDATETKPDSGLFEAALARVESTGAGGAAIGDTPWDMLAAVGAGLLPVGLRTGGFPEATLRDAGAAHVFESAAELVDQLDRTQLLEQGV
jgi:phosphoglycolate phosphatase-like HAD superfamily hydrolase